MELVLIAGLLGAAAIAALNRPKPVPVRVRRNRRQR